MRSFKRLMSIVVTLMLAILGGEVFVPAARAEQAYPIAFTNGIGIYPRTAPSMDAARNGSALPEGTMVTIECELEGQPVSNDMATISIWAKTSHGYLPNAYIHTGVDSWTPGVARCEKPEPEQKNSKSKLEHPTEGIVTIGPRTKHRVFIEYDPKRHNDLHVAWLLHGHYYATGKNAGADTIIDWRFFAGREALREAAYKVKIGDFSRPAYDARDLTKKGNSIGLASAVGRLTIYRTSEHCFTMYDYYDFVNSPWIIEWADDGLGIAHKFNVFSWGCYQ